MDNIDSRINRLVGQIEGIRKMVHKKRDCSEIAQQILAAREAMSKIGLIVMKKGICDISKGKESAKVGKLIERVFRI